MINLPDGFDLLGAPVEGFYSENEKYWTIRTRCEWKHDPDREWICLGGPGVDGIEFGVRKGRVGVFAYYALDAEFIVKAESVPELIHGWTNGSIAV